MLQIIHQYQYCVDGVMNAVVYVNVVMFLVWSCLIPYWWAARPCFASSSTILLKIHCTLNGLR